MSFYKLSNPSYKTDQEFRINNPIVMEPEHLAPALKCPACGDTWISSKRVRITTPRLQATKEKILGKPLSPSGWQTWVTEFRIEMGLPSDIEITPGAEIGLPRGTLNSAHFPEIMFPFPGQIIVHQELLDLLRLGNFTGFQAVPVQLTWEQRIKGKPEKLPSLYELVIVGKAWRVGVTGEKITACEVCSRRIFLNPYPYNIDMSRWRGTDFFTLDDNPNIVVVTDKVCTMFQQVGVRNYSCFDLT